MSSKSVCPGGHPLVHNYSEGKHKGPRCPLCLSVPTLRKVAMAQSQKDKLEQHKEMATVLHSVTRRNMFDTSYDAEAMSLALGEDKEWRMKQLEVMRAIQKSLMVAKFSKSKKVTFSHMSDTETGAAKMLMLHQQTLEWHHYANLLIDCGILEVVIFLLQIRLPVHKLDEVDMLNDPWEAVYYYSFDIISNIMLTSYWDNPKAKTFIRTMSQSRFIDASMPFIDDAKHFLARVLSIYVLCHIYESYPNAGYKLIQAGLIPKFGHYLHKDNGVHIMNDWMNIGVFSYEIEVLMENQCGLLPMRSNSSFDIGEALNYTDDDIKDVGIQFASTLQQSSLQCLGFLSKDKQIREHTTKDPMVIKAIVRWLRMPVLAHENRYMLEACLKVVHDMVHVSDFALKLLDDYGFMELLEYGMYYPDKDVIWHYSEVATRIAMHRGLLLKRIVQNPTIMRSAALHMYSLECNCQVYGTALMALALDNPGIDNIIKYFGPRHLYYYPEYFCNRTPIIGIKISELQVGCKRYGRKKFDAANREFRKTRNLTLDKTKATNLKEEGNTCYKNGQCEEAIVFYTRALNVCPPTKAERRGSTGMPKWFSLPATLLSNRAQCYLNLGEYEKAVEDCDEAIARCLGGTDDDDPALPDTVRIKAMFRRSKALYELGRYFRAVQDVGECEMTQPSEIFKAHLDKAMMRFRLIMGMDPVQRCDECRLCKGFKLKRCANCMAIYCSKKCQQIAWIKRHKTNCQEYQAEKLAAQKKNEAAHSSNSNLDFD